MADSQPWDRPEIVGVCYLDNFCQFITPDGTCYPIFTGPDAAWQLHHAQYIAYHNSMPLVHGSGYQCRLFWDDDTAVLELRDRRGIIEVRGSHRIGVDAPADDPLHMVLGAMSGATVSGLMGEEPDYLGVSGNGRQRQDFINLCRALTRLDKIKE